MALRSQLPDTPALAKPQRPPDASLGLQLLLCGAISILILVSLRRQRPQPLSAESPSYLRLQGLSRREALIAVASVLTLLAVAWTALYVTKPTGRGPVREPVSRTTEPTPSDTVAPPRQPSGPPDQAGSDAAMLILGAVLVGMAVMVLMLKRYDSDQPVSHVDQVADDDHTTSGSLAHLVELGLAEVADPGRDPRASIIACYAAMEQGLTVAPDAAPLESDTPSEVLQRAVDIGALQSQAGTQLVSLFSEARFSPHQMTQTDRESAAQCLRTVLDDLRSKQ